MSTTLDRPRPRLVERSIPLRLLAALALLQAVSPLATDLYLPALPALAKSLSTTSSGAALTLTAFLVGTALGQLVFGPLSDRFGRRRPLLAGAGLACLASAAAVLAPTLDLLLAARLVQGVACAAGMVIGRAVVADLAKGRGAAQAFSLMMSISGLAPIVAPVLGGGLAGALGWRGILAVVTALCLVALLVVVAVIPETNPATARSVARADGALTELRSPRFVGHALICAFGFAAIMAYVSSAPFLYERMLGVTPAEFGLLFGANALVLVTATFTSSRLVRRWEPARVIRLGLRVLSSATGLLLLAAVLQAPPVAFAIVLPCFLAGIGLTMGNAAATAITSVPGASGVASAVLGCSQFALGGIGSALVGLNADDPARSLAVLLAGCVAVMVAGFTWARRSGRRSVRS